MATRIDAIYENGVLRPLEPLDLEDRQVVRITLDAGEFEDLVDHEFTAALIRNRPDTPPRSTSDVRALLSSLEGSLSDDIRAERDLG